MKSISKFLNPLAVALALFSCSQEQLKTNDSSSTTEALDVAQTSGQLASGTSFRINGSSTDSTSTDHPRGHHGHHGHHGPLDGLSLLPPTDELLAIADAESAGDFRGMRLSSKGGATITHYDKNGVVVSLPEPGDHERGGPQGCSFSGKQFPVQDSILSTIVKTVVDFGTGVTFNRDTISITRAGKIIIERSGNMTNMTELTTFENYSVNGIGIVGTKTRTSSLDSSTGAGLSTTSVSGGKIILADGTVTTWSSDRTRTSSITLDANGKPSSGTIVTEVETKVTKSNGEILYSHVSSKPLTENVACDGRHHGPVSGTIETVYGADSIHIDFGDGSCENQTITLTINGVTTTKTIGE
jgi:hypothetical protein